MLLGVVLIFGSAHLCLTRAVMLELEKARSSLKYDIPKARIIGGGVMDPHSIKFIAHMILRDNATNRLFACGGTLITSRHILTAAHCLHGLNVDSIELGAHNLSAPETTKLIVYPEKFSIHENYSRRLDENDIGIIKLCQHVTSNRYIDIVKLEDASDITEDYVGKPSETYGWGLIHSKPRVDTEVLRGVEVYVISNSECLSFAPSRNVYEGDICTSGTNVVGGCQGDSGGPLIADDKQIGITSRGLTDEGCEVSKPTVFTRVAFYRDWIDEKLKE